MTSHKKDKWKNKRNAMIKGVKAAEQERKDKLAAEVAAERKRMNTPIKEAVISFVQDLLNERFEALEETKRATKDRIKNIASDREGEAYKSDNTDGARKMSALAGRHGPKGGTGKKSKEAGWVKSARKASNTGKTPMQAAQDKKRRREAEAKHPNLRR